MGGHDGLQPEQTVSQLDRFKREQQVTIRPDSDGFVGRECPSEDCLGYFKLTPGTGLPGIDYTHCPYCGIRDHSNSFFTQDQIEYAKSVVAARFEKALYSDLEPVMRDFDRSLREMGRAADDLLSALSEQRREGSLSARCVVPPPPRPVVRHYREQRLETVVVCDRCTLRYAIFGVFGYCPDCGIHNSEQMLGKNLDIVEKMLMIVGSHEAEVGEKLLENALEDAVSTFDGFGRAVCRVTDERLPGRGLANISFQSLAGARDRLLSGIGFDLASAVTPVEWTATLRSFQKRHLLAHSLGVIDAKYLQHANDPAAVLGRRVHIDAAEVSALLNAIRRLGAALVAAATTAQ